MGVLDKETILKQFPQLEQPLLDELLKQSSLNKVEEGEEVMRTGQYIRSTILLLSGLLKIYRVRMTKETNS
jgi:CRP/FNR family transcriptional regulator